MLDPDQPAVILAPMDGITDAPMRALQGSTGAFTYAVSEFIRVSHTPLPAKVFKRDVPELLTGSKTHTGLPVQVQILGGDPENMAISAQRACQAGATAIDINFGCPAPTVNRNDGGASLLREPERIKEIVKAVRAALPPQIPVSAKLRLGWDDINSIHLNAQMAEQGGASWITIHARTKVAGYTPPVYWPKIREVRSAAKIPVVANGDIWTIEDFQRCQQETGCIHFMLGRGALANPALPHQIASHLNPSRTKTWDGDWIKLLQNLASEIELSGQKGRALVRVKQWLKLAHLYGSFPAFHEVKEAATLNELFTKLQLSLTFKPEPAAV